MEWNTKKRRRILVKLSIIGSGGRSLAQCRGVQLSKDGLLSDSSWQGGQSVCTEFLVLFSEKVTTNLDRCQSIPPTPICTPFDKNGQYVDSEIKTSIKIKARDNI